MRVPYFIYPQLHPGPDSTPSGTTNFAPNFKPSSLTDSMDSLVAHVAGVRLQLAGSIIQPAAGAAIRSDDWALLMAQSNNPTFVEGRGVQFNSRGEDPVQCSFLSALRITQSVNEMNGVFEDLSQIGPALPAVVNQTTTPVVLNFPIRFFNERWVDPFRFIKPLMWWNNGGWQFYLSDPATVFGAGFAWSAAPTFRLTVDLLMSPHIIMCPPFEWREKINATTATATTQIQPAVYQTGGFVSPAFGGASGFCCDDLVAKVAQIYNTDYRYRYPSEIVPLDYAAMQNSRGAYGGVSPFGADFTGSRIGVTAANGAPKLATIQLFGPRWSGPREEAYWNEFRLDKQINWNVNLVTGQSLTQQHQFYFSRSLARSGCGEGNLAGPQGDIIKGNVISALGSGCGGGFSNFVPYVPPGQEPPHPDNLNRATLVSYRVA